MNKIISKVLGNKYDDLWRYVIRPEKDDYSLADLGPSKFKHNNNYFKRTDFTLTNKRNLKLCCSFWEPEQRKYPKLPCVIYLHGNSSSRAEIYPELYYLLSSEITVFAFDFSGCGKSEGEYISLGWYERDDVECVVNYLRSTDKVTTIGLWGRSMGAVTAIMYGDRDPSIAGLVLDSPFCSLKVLTEELAKERASSIPNFVLNQGVKMIRETIKEKAKFDINDIEPKVYAERCFIPALFCHGLNDTFVNVHHCQDLYDVYAGEKNVTYVEGDHNSVRPNFFLDSVAIFFYNSLHVENLKELNYGDKIGNIQNINPNHEEGENNNDNKNGDNNGDNNKNGDNNNNNFINNNNNLNIYPNINDFQNDFGGMGEESEEEILKRVLELSKNDY
jgi:cephalosporin-C deacetylase-like acetyl esterase